MPLGRRTSDSTLGPARVNCPIGPERTFLIMTFCTCTQPQVSKTTAFSAGFGGNQQFRRPVPKKMRQCRKILSGVVDATGLEANNDVMSGATCSNRKGPLLLPGPKVSPPGPFFTPSSSRVTWFRRLFFTYNPVWTDQVPAAAPTRLRWGPNRHASARITPDTLAIMPAALTALRAPSQSGP